MRSGATQVIEANFNFMAVVFTSNGHEELVAWRVCEKRLTDML
jgi:hypothetical protein